MFTIIIQGPSLKSIIEVNRHPASSTKNVIFFPERFAAGKRGIIILQNISDIVNK